MPAIGRHGRSVLPSRDNASFNTALGATTHLTRSHTHVQHAYTHAHTQSVISPYNEYNLCLLLAKLGSS